MTNRGRAGAGEFAAAGSGAAGGPAGASRRVAAVDCGTNSLRLLIADVEPASRRLTDVCRAMEIVRLGQGVDATGRLAGPALDRTFAVLRRYAAVISESGAAAVRMVATSATRDASNAAEFTAGVRDILGVEPEVVTGSQEAYLSFTGATAELRAPERSGGAAAETGGAAAGGAAAGGAAAAREPYLVVDIGGGSTEFVLGPDPDSAAVRSGAAGSPESGPGGARLSALSVNIGCVRLTERHLRGDPPARQQVAAATADIDAALGEVARRIDVTAARTLVGLAGSVTTVTALALGLRAYDPGRIHHAVISATRVHEVTAGLLAQTRAERALHGAMHPGRVDVIAAGALILDRIMGKFGFEAVMASEHDLLDGIAWSVADGVIAR